MNYFVPTFPINCFQSFEIALTCFPCILDDNRSVYDASQTFSPHRIHSNCLRPDDSETLSARFQSKKIDLQSASRKLKKIVCPQASMYLQPCFVQISRFALIPKMLWFKIYLIWSSTWDFFGYNLTSAKVLRDHPKIGVPSS